VPACGQPGAATLASIFSTAAGLGCSPLTENSCSFGPNPATKCTTDQITGGSELLEEFNAANGITPSPSPPVAVTGDPHLSLPHGGGADFRGEHNEIYNFLSAKNLAVNVMTQMADFELHDESSPLHKHVHGSFLTQVHVIARSNTGKIVRVSSWADKIGPRNIAYANGTVDDQPAFALGPKMKKVVDDLILETNYSSLVVTTPEFQVTVTPNAFIAERNVVGPLHRFDVSFKLLVPEDSMLVLPHGIIGQGWDKDGKSIDGEKDVFPKSGEFTTYAMAKGAIEGSPNDYKVASKYATDFKFSRFDLVKSSPRDVASLVSAGVLNSPKTGVQTESVGSTEYKFEEV
jgi:hypothetical protein